MRPDGLASFGADAAQTDKTGGGTALVVAADMTD
jgi:hypothetical protein